MSNLKTINIKNVDGEIYLKLRSKLTLENKPVGRWLNEVMAKEIKKESSK